ncbi:MAG: tRNA 2-thiouridine(34) synthase MnmA [Anaerolineae bacterium]
MVPQPPAKGRSIAVAMSGGVDSSVAALLLQKQGWSVAGFSMRLWHWKSPGDDNRSELLETARICELLGIEHRIVDLHDQFHRVVVKGFAATYAQGRTPNPCPGCNRTIKFGALRKAARELGYRWFATGHYARVIQHADGPQLLRARDLSKDQSYVLYAIPRDALSHTIFPLGNLLKSEVRDIADNAGLPSVKRAESQDLCFVPKGDYAELVRRLAPRAAQPGSIRSVDGELLGTHGGLAYYTVGQRRGLGLSASRPYYVLRLDAATNTVIVAHADQLGCQELDAVEMRYQVSDRPPAGSWFRAKVRYRASAVGATIWPLSDGRVRLALARPLRDITPGQHVVLYRGECVIGGGIIQRTLPPGET